jgi:hypothetical protein
MKKLETFEITDVSNFFYQVEKSGKFKKFKNSLKKDFTNKKSRAIIQNKLDILILI